MAMEELANKGPLKPEELQGLSNYEEAKGDTSVQLGLKKMPQKIGTRAVEEKNHVRTGWLLDEEITKKMLQHITEAKAVIHKSQVAKKIPLTEKMLLEQFDILKGVMMISYPGYHGLGEWEPARIILESTAELEDDDVSFWLKGSCIRKIR